ncbi:ARF-like small GTPase [Haematococcus lacustris]
MGAFKRLKKLLMKMGVLKMKVTVIMLGLSGSGKTSIVHVLAREALDQVVPTMGYAIDKVAWRAQHATLTTLDMSGASKYHSLWTRYYDQAEGVVFVVDACCDATSLAEAKDVLHSVLESPQLQGRPLLLLANKQDLAGAASPGYLAALLGVSSGSCRGREFSVQGCSAIKGEGVEDGMTWLLQRVRAAL